MDHKQKGQALVYVSLMLASIVMVGAYVFNSYSVANEKTRLQNTADAAAYSVAVIEARDLNFKAYTNRAMVANQVAVAQMVSMVSWIRWLDDFAKNLKTVTSWIPYLNAVTAAVSNAVKAVKQGAEPAISAGVTGINAYLALISEAQRIMHYANVGVAKATIEYVLKENDPQVDWSMLNAAFLASYFNSHERFTSRYKPNTVRDKGRNWKSEKKRVDEFRNVTLNSRDGFSTNRTYNWPKVNLLLLKIVPRKEGVTRMTSKRGLEHAPYYRWAALDTFSLHFELNLLFDKIRWEVPFATGGAYAGDGCFLCHKYGDKNKLSTRIGVERANRERETGRFNGLRPFYGLADPGLLEEGPGITLVIAKPHSGGGVATIRKLGMNVGKSINIESEGGMLGDRMSSVSKATTYFSRPNDIWARRGGAQREYGSLYNPYWQARLKELTLQDKGLVLAALALK